MRDSSIIPDSVKAKKALFEQKSSAVAQSLERKPTLSVKARAGTAPVDGGRARNLSNAPHPFQTVLNEATTSSPNLETPIQAAQSTSLKETSPLAKGASESSLLSGPSVSEYTRRKKELDPSELGLTQKLSVFEQKINTLAKTSLPSSPSKPSPTPLTRGGSGNTIYRSNASPAFTRSNPALLTMRPPRKYTKSESDMLMDPQTNDRKRQDESPSRSSLASNTQGEPSSLKHTFLRDKSLSIVSKMTAEPLSGMDMGSSQPSSYSSSPVKMLTSPETYSLGMNDYVDRDEYRVMSSREVSFSEKPSETCFEFNSFKEEAIQSIISTSTSLQKESDLDFAAKLDGQLDKGNIQQALQESLRNTEYELKAIALELSKNIQSKPKENSQRELVESKMVSALSSEAAAKPTELDAPIEKTPLTTLDSLQLNKKESAAQVEVVSLSVNKSDSFVSSDISRASVDKAEIPLALHSSQVSKEEFAVQSDIVSIKKKDSFVTADISRASVDKKDNVVAPDVSQTSKNESSVQGVQSEPISVAPTKSVAKESPVMKLRKAFTVHQNHRQSQPKERVLKSQDDSTLSRSLEDVNKSSSHQDIPNLSSGVPFRKATVASSSSSQKRPVNILHYQDGSASSSAAPSRKNTEIKKATVLSSHLLKVVIAPEPTPEPNEKINRATSFKLAQVKPVQIVNLSNDDEEYRDGLRCYPTPAGPPIPPLERKPVRGKLLRHVKGVTY